MLRGSKVILDEDLAALYEVETKVLNRAVGRNRGRFPGAFMFWFDREEFDPLEVPFWHLKCADSRIFMDRVVVAGGHEPVAVRVICTLRQALSVLS